jgi:hypothetical protein
MATKQPFAFSRLQNVNQAQAAEAEQVKALASQGFNADGSPVKPEFQGISNADGTLKDNYVLNDHGDVSVNMDAYNQIRGMALRDPSQQSAWAKMMTDKQGAEEQMATEQARRQGEGAQAEGYSQMAMRGGMNSGARERMAQMNMRNQLMNQQQIGRQGQLSRMDIGLQDENQRQDMVKNLSQLDAQKAQLDLSNRSYHTGVDQFNLGNRLKEVDSQRGFTMDTYKEQMSKWAANKQADAQAKASGGK